MHWIVWCVIAFMVMSEWPKGGTLGQSGWRRFADSWKTTGAGIVTFALAGLLGCIMFHRSPLSPESSFQNLMPVFTGLFTIPALLLNVVSRLDVPKQATAGAGVLAGTSPGVILTGSLGGVMGGAFAAFVPAVTGGVGGMLAGHATAVRDDRVFLVSQGASKCVYYVGGLLLLFVPGLNITRGCGAAMVTSLGVPGTIGDFHMALGCAALAAAVAYMLTGPLARAAIGMIERFGSRRISAIALAGVAALVLGFTGIPGLGVATVATGIGLLPLLYGSRRMNCLSVVLLPMALDMSGMGPAVMEVLGL
jgi:putative membrane protein